MAGQGHDYLGGHSRVCKLRDEPATPTMGRRPIKTGGPIQLRPQLTECVRGKRRSFLCQEQRTFDAALRKARDGITVARNFPAQALAHENDALLPALGDAGTNAELLVLAPAGVPDEPNVPAAIAAVRSRICGLAVRSALVTPS